MLLIKKENFKNTINNLSSFLEERLYIDSTSSTRTVPGTGICTGYSYCIDSQNKNHTEQPQAIHPETMQHQ